MCEELEIWVPLAGYSENYIASNQGRIRRRKKQFIQQRAFEHGLKAVKIPHESRFQWVHTLVLSSFKRNPDPARFRYVKHGNGWLHDNHIDNLLWSDDPKDAPAACPW